MTAWITTKTNRFKAAEADRMISDWTAWWGTSDAQGLTNNEFFVFRNAEGTGLSVIYRRKDGNYGLIDSESA